MVSDEERFQQHLMATFRGEAAEHLDSLSRMLLALEQSLTPEQQAARVESLFREAHSLKGAARSVAQDEIESLCHAMESLLARHKKQRSVPDAAELDTLHAGVDALRALVGGDAVAVAALAAALDGAEPAAAPDSAPAAPAPAPVPAETAEAESGDTIRIAAARLDGLLLQAEEHIAFKFSAAHLAGELSALRAMLAEWKKEADQAAGHARAWRRAAGRDAEAGKAALLEHVLQSAEHSASFAKEFGQRMAQVERAALQEKRSLCSTVDGFLESMKEALMQPFSSLFLPFPALVRTQARASGKQVQLVLEGGATVADRRILEQLKAPLLHLVTNAVDHGIELPQERARKGKPAEGRVTLSVRLRTANRIELVVEDDGGGIDPAGVAAAAVRLGVAGPQQVAGQAPEALRALVFESGLSTAPILTDVSGRGLGLAIVREKVEQLGGTVELQQPDGGGTRFRMLLPAALATWRGVVVEAAGQAFVLPLRNVERVALARPGQLADVEGRATVELGGRVTALYQLAALLGLPAQRRGDAAPDGVQVLLLAAAGKRIACQVDAVLAEQEVVLKELGPLLPRVRNLAGATITGPGRVLPVLNVEDLLASAQHAPAPPEREREPQPPAAGARSAVLVVDDSVTSRALLKNILEAADYEVATAVDGMDALLALRRGHFDVLVSDVDMPRMDGFELTARVRADKRLADLPVILVTSLDSREHKERGIDVGATAYIVKSSFEQSNLLDTVRRVL